MNCVPIGPYSWYVNLVPVYQFSVSLWIGPLYLHPMYIVSPYHCTHAMWQRIITTTCLHIPMHSPHNLSLVEKCVIKLSYVAQPLIILYASAIAAYADFKSLFAYTICDHTSYWFTHPYACVCVVQMALYNS